MTAKYKGLWFQWTLYFLFRRRICFGCWMAHRDQDRDVQQGDFWKCAEGDHWKPTFKGAIDRHRLGTFEWPAPQKEKQP